LDGREHCDATPIPEHAVGVDGCGAAVPACSRLKGRDPGPELVDVDRGSEPVLETVVPNGRSPVFDDDESGIAKRPQCVEALTLARPTNERDVRDIHAANLKAPHFTLVSE
jgi:hypothetical protein